MADPGLHRGVVLVVALLMVLVTTLLGLTVMGVGVTETRTITNTQVDRANLHAAETAALDALRATDPGMLPIVGDTVIAVTSADDRFEVSVIGRHEGRVPLANSSLRMFARSAFAVEAEAVASGFGARRSVVLGATQLVPLAP